ncbi:MAG: stress protein [Bacilli bacterium]|nr:stress protein [Bacilli bacterium]
MVEHIVIFKFREQLSSDKEKELVDLVYSFKKRIPGVVDVSAGINVTEETEKIHGYQFGFRITFENQDYLRNYRPHPVHKEFGQAIKGLTENVIVMDYPILTS